MKKIINEIIDKIDLTLKFDEDDYVDFGNKKYKAVKISNDNFHGIREKKISKKICFVDGGNNEIIKANNFSLQFIRVYYNIFKDNKKVKSNKFEFFLFVNCVGKRYNASFFSIKGDLKVDNLQFDYFDKSLSVGEHRVSISKIGETARRFLELEICNKTLDDLDSEDLLVMDRNLEIDVTNEEKFFDRIYEKALEKEVIVGGLSKTTNLLTKKGNSVNALLNSLGAGEWYYWPLAEINEFDMYFVKFNERSRYCFRLDISNKVKYDINEVMNLLMENSKDAVFIGYPYGLIEADKFARVSNNDKKYLRTMFMTKFGKNAENIKKYEASLDAHDILDSIL